ncbi:hypothetical protein M3M35_05785 [Fructilactobacillus myrtifloralis]|uniref:Lipoprotein n=1 Tax=Fructilactobacillus myrtifloralis TaxID=2940301 RepID=A0ABY5BPD2_9LACO|nr:hypothetical protein [Fructilactobacillus myrtifloralis]USS84816.1 hypothetical protein M3M35_05785 [Fructilactobacillus myrtifloralis]
MRRTRMGLLLIMGCLVLLTLAGCQNFSVTDQGHDSVKVYDANHQLVRQATHVRQLDAITNHKYQAFRHQAVPKDAQVNYRYVIHQRQHNLKLTVVVYSNYRLAKISGIPVLGSGTVALTPTQFKELNDPERLIAQ